ncbi:MAG: hypothetical protein KOO62_02055 [candidate division Zixibacteria bacterium]|nr:hypothetical protein [candidate division Zixibacteria bacterium]
MWYRNLIIGLAALLLTFGVGCSGDSVAEPEASVMDQVIDSLASALAENLAEVGPPLAAAEEAEPLVPSTLDGVDDGPEFDAVADVIVVDSTVYSALKDGVLIYNLSTRKYQKIASDGPINALASFAGEVYAGGDGLYKIIGSTLEPVDMELTGVITELCASGYRLVIGTECALYARSIFGHELLMDDIEVTALASEMSDLWVGTNGQGLYRWDGREFRRRFLRRDTTIFDYVSTLDFNHDHLYVGSADGMYIYDGGKWRTLTVDDGLPSNDVRVIDASAWVVYIGTADGVVSYFNGKFTPVKKLDRVTPVCLAVKGRSILVGSEGDGLLCKTGPIVAELLGKSSDQPLDPLALIGQ